MIVHALRGDGVVAVAFHLVARRADLLAVAEITALADIDVASALFQRRVGPQTVRIRL
jgi:hypothetical protein